MKEKKETLIPRVEIKISEVDSEIQRYRKALKNSRLDLEEIQIGLAQDGSIEAVTIIDSHIRMLEDPFMTTYMEDKIRKMMLNTETVFQSAISDYEKQFSKMQDSFFRQRLIDVQDLSQRVLRHLYLNHQFDLKSLEEESIVFAREFCPSNVAEAPIHLVSGLVASYGSSTAHAGLIARAKGLPFLIQIDFELIKEYEGEIAIIDSEKELLIVQPNQKTLEAYLKRREEEKNLLEFSELNLPEVAKTRDGVEVKVLANLDCISDLKKLSYYHADGIGLFRSEFLFFEGDQNNFREETQLKIYSNLVQDSCDQDFVFRVFDFGGDKKFITDQQQETNPALGLRSIRFLLRYKDIFKTQLRALFKAANNRKLHLLLPFISDVEEVLECKCIIQQVLAELEDQVQLDLKIGAMIEMPSAVILCHHIADQVDFISVGTNDLIQYTLASDRQSATMQDIFKSTHPSIIIMLKMIVDVAEKKNKPVCLCGEMASNPLFTKLLVGLGFKALSCSMRYIPNVKGILSKIDSLEAKKLAEEVLKMSTATDIHRILTDQFCQLQLNRD